MNIQWNIFKLRENEITSRLLSRRFIDPLTNCWLWLGAKDSSGYGSINIDGKQGGLIFDIKTK